MVERKRILCFLLCFVLLLCSGCSFSGSSDSGNGSSGNGTVEDSVSDKEEQEKFQQWCREQFTDTLEEMDTLNLHYTLKNPETYGITEEAEDISFGDISVEDMKESDEENTETYQELKSFSYKKLTEEQQLTYDVLEFYLELCEAGKGFELYNFLLSPDLGIPANIPVSLAEYPLYSAKDVETYLTLLQKLPEYFQQLTAYEKEVSAEGLFISDATLDDSLKQMRDFIEKPESNYLITTFSERLDEIQGLSKKQKRAYEKQNQERVQKYVIPAYQQLIEEMEALRGTGTNEGGLCHFEKGKEYYSYLAKYYTCSDMEVEEIWDILEQRLKNLMKRLSVLVVKDPELFDKYDSIQYSMTDPNEILVYLQKQMQEYYPECPSVNYTVKHVDESLAESLSPAFYMVPQIDNYKDNTIYINDKSSNFLQEDLFSTLAHEGFPGHLYQTTYYDSTNPEPLRQILNFGGYSEGWATYVELSSYELYDFGEDDAALTDLCQIESELSLALSSMADIGVNYKGWDKSRLKEFLDNYNMGENSIVDSIYTLVVEDPANYLQYYVSYLEFWNLRCKAKTEKRTFTSREFHKVILDCGPAPFTVLEKQVDKYLFKKHLLESGVDERHIIEMAFDLFDNIEYRDPKIFYPWAKRQLKDDGKYYFLLDEVQLLDEFVSVLNGLADKKNCDVFVTGSNAKFLSSDIATEFGGRGDEVHMYPLSFSEFMSVYDGNRYDGWNEYITYGGIPLVVLAGTEEQKMALLDNLFKETYISDIVKRNKIRNVGEMEALLDVLSSAIGALTNPNKLQNTFKSVNKSKITATTITKYIEYLEDAFLIEEANRYDIKGKSYIGTPLKYYFMDMGLRNSRINFRQLEVTHSMENVIYNELRMRGFNVDVGNLTITEKGKEGKAVKKQLEVDFICNKGSKKYYIQSAYMLGTAEKMAQEIRPFLKINDSFKKIVITSDTPKPFYTEDGILIMNVYDFLLNDNSLEL